MGLLVNEWVEKGQSNGVFWMRREMTNGLGELVGVTAEGVDVTDRGGCSTVAEQHGEGVDTFLVIVVEIPKLFK